MSTQYNYSKSSCNCVSCENKVFPYEEKGNPTNRAVRNCKIPDVFTCSDTYPFKTTIEPVNEKGYQFLNKEGSGYSKDFFPVKCNNTPSSCPDVQYSSMDPRLLYAPTAQRLTLDRPPNNGSIPLNRIATERSLDNYGKVYNGYSDIKAGDIVYYIDNEQKNAYFEPNFTISSIVNGSVYKDPMGSLKPQYERVPIKHNDPLNTNRDNYMGSLSWIQDTTEHREDMLAHQMSKRFRERWEPRWE